MNRHIQLHPIPNENKPGGPKRMIRLNDSNHLFVRAIISSDLLYMCIRPGLGDTGFTLTMAKVPITNYCITNVFYTMSMDPCAYVLASLK